MALRKPPMQGGIKLALPVLESLPRKLNDTVRRDGPGGDVEAYILGKSGRPCLSGALLPPRPSWIGCPPLVVQALASLCPLAEGDGRWRQRAVAQTEDAVVGLQPGRLKWHQRDAVFLRHLLQLCQRCDADRVTSANDAQASIQGLTFYLRLEVLAILREPPDCPCARQKLAGSFGKLWRHQRVLADLSNGQTPGASGDAPSGNRTEADGGGVD